ncbi:MAG: quinolinate synthase [Candidatus Aminicenantes bacterium RBG_13_63_10]|nr:MAG: quinolinate synthase [Candidatus Aminicenantes bacterium RBG_13_63_10]
MTKTDILERIGRLKAERRAVLLAHNYQVGEVQDAADFVGDSLELSRKAADTEAEVIVFCGVHFMAETAAILSPGKTVLLPEIEAGCPMADMITADELRAWKERYPGRKVVCYVNTSAEVKAESDVCCTSSNVLRVVNSIPDEEILFVPDKNLADFAARRTSKKIIAWDGYCYVHNNIRAADIRDSRVRYPGAEVWAHPECRPEVIDLADKALSTGQMIREAQTMPGREAVLATEPGIIHRLKKENPAKDFHPAKVASLCVNMKKTSLAKVLTALERNQFRVVVAPDIARRARGAIEKMISL